MKNIFISLIMCILFFNFTNAQISQSQALTLVGNYYLNQDVNVFISKNSIPPQTKIETMHTQFTSPNVESWFVFVDKKPCSRREQTCVSSSLRLLYNRHIYPTLCLRSRQTCLVIKKYSLPLSVNKTKTGACRNKGYTHRFSLLSFFF